MRHLLEKVRRQPEESRKAVAFLSSLALTGIIFIVWFMGAARDFNGTMVIGDTVYQSAASGAIPDVDSPFSTFSARAGTAIEGLRDSVTRATEQINDMSAGGVEYERAE